MKKAFTMIEIIFVIVILAILAGVSTTIFPDYSLRNDTNYILMKIKEKQKSAIGYNGQNFGDDLWSNDNNISCIDLDKNALILEERNSKEAKKHILKSDLNTSVKLCFDNIGRPYYPMQEQLLLDTLDIGITYKKKSKTISIMPVSGYAIMK